MGARRHAALRRTPSVSYVPLDGGETIQVAITAYSGAPATHIRIVVLGYLALGDTAFAGGRGYSELTACAAFDTRTGLPNDTNPASGAFAGKRVAGTSGTNLTGVTTYQIAGTIPAAQGGETDCGVPESAEAVLINLVAIQPDVSGNFRAYATGSSPTGGVVNFNALSPAMNNSNAVVVPISAAGQIDLFVNAPSNDGDETVHARGVVLGYYG